MSDFIKTILVNFTELVFTWEFLRCSFVSVFILGLLFAKWVSRSVTFESLAYIIFASCVSQMIFYVLILGLVVALIVTPIVLFAIFVWPKIKDKKIL